MVNGANAVESADKPITPEQVVGWEAKELAELRLPTFDEFVRLYIYHPNEIEGVINKFSAGINHVFRINSVDDWTTKSPEKRQAFDLAATELVKGLNDNLRFETPGPAVVFVPANDGKHTPQSYRVVSHPFDAFTVQEKLERRGLTAPYIWGGALQASMVTTMCLAHPEEGLILASVPGESRVDWRKLADALGFNSARKKRMMQYNGSLDEALGMVAGRVTPLVHADKLHNLAAVVIDSRIESAVSPDISSYLEIPLNVRPYLLRTGLSKENRDTTLAYDPRKHSLAEALRTCYGADKIRVAEVIR